MGEIRGRTTSHEQNEIIDYVDRVLRGEKARSHGSSMKITDLSGRPDERMMLGGIFVASVLHYAAGKPAPTSDETTDSGLWRDGFAIHQTLNGFREGNGKIPQETASKLMEYGPGDDRRLQIGHTLFSGLEKLNLDAQYVAKDALMTMIYVLGHSREVAA